MHQKGHISQSNLSRVKIVHISPPWLLRCILSYAILYSRKDPFVRLGFVRELLTRICDANHFRFWPRVD